MTIEAEAIAHRVACSLFRVELPVVSNQLGCCSSSTTSPPADCKDQQLAMPAWVTSHVSYRGMRGGVAQCGGPGRTDHSSPKELAERVMRPCLAHRVVDAAAAEQDDVTRASESFCSVTRSLTVTLTSTVSTIPETRSWAARLAAPLSRRSSHIDRRPLSG